MQTSAPLTDTAALIRNRARANSDALFLHREAAAELHDRISLVNRSFTSPAVVSGFSALWGNEFGVKVTPDSETLILEPAAHDLIVHAFSLHWANDPVGQLIQCRQALRPDGLFHGVFFGGQTLNELRTCLAEAEIEITGGLSPRVAPMGEIRDLGALLQRAGFALPVADSLPLTVSYSDAFILMRDLQDMGEASALSARPRTFTRRSIFARAAELYAQNFVNSEGRITATFDLIFLTGWAPDAGQPQPLRPGSATNRLADALNTSESKLPD